MHMPQLQLQVAGAVRLRPKSGRKPLHPKNTPADPSPKSVSKPKPDRIDSLQDKENHPDFAFKVITPVKMEPLLDSSLADELSAVRKKLERLRQDKEKTEKMLRERDLFLEKQMKEIQSRGEAQKLLEIEVDRLYRLKQLQLACMRVSPILSLREKQKDKKSTGLHSISLELKFDDDSEESVGENDVVESRSPISSESLVKK